MSPPPSLKQIDTSQLDDADEWFLERFLPQLNSFLRDVSSLLAGRLTRGDNIRGEEREIAFTTGAIVALDTSPFPLYLTPQFARAPRHITITCPNLDSIPEGACQPIWRLTSDGRVEIRRISGLMDNTSYKMRFLLE